MSSAEMFTQHAIYLLILQHPSRGGYVQVSGVLQTGRQCSERLKKKKQYSQIKTGEGEIKMIG